MPSPLVTVFIPVHDRERYIGASVQSILQQDFEDFELLVVDDGSSDGTLRQLEAIADRRLRVECNGANRGIPYTRNRGLELARGEFIALLDSDDVAYPRRLSRQLRALQRHPELAQIGSWCTLMDADGRPLGRTRRQPLRADDVDVHLLFHCPLINRTIMARTAVLRRYGYDEHFRRCQDYDLHARMAPTQRMANLGVSLVCGREHEGRFTGQTGSLGEARKREIQARLLDALGLRFDEAELDRHYRLTRASAGSAAEAEAMLAWTRDWLDRIDAANRRSGRYAQPALRRALGALWLASVWRLAGPLGATGAWRQALRSPRALSALGNLHPSLLLAASRPRLPVPAVARLP